jgi:NAD-dependent deacetylase sirtuin 2
MDLTEFIDKLQNGNFQNIVVLTGAGVSINGNNSSYRGKGGLFNILEEKFNIEATTILSRNYEKSNPKKYKEEILPLIQKSFEDAVPTKTHKLCGWLNEKGWLRRVYTQNVDGLHQKCLPKDKVVEFHGNIISDNIILYGDEIHQNVLDMCKKDFTENPIEIDLIIVLGTSLQVAPFCALPNIVPPNCTRVLVNTSIEDCYTNSWVKTRPFEGLCSGKSWIKIGRKHVSLRPQWIKCKKKWKQLLLKMCCDEFSSLII